ncbi:hypothetical protein GPJ56_010604 [Histomonas meleagridis]|uniref:uncharacterized protein n=1 Tax=Histomonas meleagridis TaxID=135588 RepID=UPI003559BC2D|nr:hypothetical protein GPJ56_010604 [Histomonas meleagridis]KAH0803999.1 hypothetical protein GO595_002829 [Histomonas meleagridis]
MEKKQLQQDLEINDFIDLARPLINRKGKSTTTLCLEYSKIFEKTSYYGFQMQGKIWLLLSMITDRSSSVPQSYQPLIRQMPSIEIYLIFFFWLSKIYDFTKEENPTDEPNTTFEFIRKGDYEGFLNYIQEMPKHWKPVMYTGSFSPAYYKRWRQTALNYMANANTTEEEKTIMSALCANKDTLYSFSHNFFDKLWSELYILISNAICGTYEQKIETPEPQSLFEKLTLLFLDPKINHLNFKSILGNKEVPLVLRVHISIVFGQIDQSVLEDFIDLLVQNYLLDHVILYASFAPKENALEIISRIYSGLPEPEKRVFNVSQQVGLDSFEVADGIVKFTICSQKDDFDGYVNEQELSQRKINSLKWMKLISATKEQELLEARRLISRFVIEGNFIEANNVFKQFQSYFDDKYEISCWNILFKTEHLYAQWKNGSGDAKQLIQSLYDLIKYPNGWMKKSALVDREVGQHCIPLVTNQLLEALCSIKDYDRALGLSCLLCDGRQILRTYFQRNDAMLLLQEIKRIAIGKYRMNQSVQ